MVLVEDGAIAKVGAESATTIPRGAVVVDLDGLFLLPGLIDCHVHLSGRRTMDTRREVFTGPGLMTARAVADARALLESGFTTVRDAGRPHGARHPRRHRTRGASRGRASSARARSSSPPAARTTCRSSRRSGR